MNKKLQRVIIVIAVIIAIVLLTFVIYSACQAFGRNEVTLADADYLSRDGNVKISIRDSNVLIITPETRNTYKANIVDRNILELVNGEEKQTALFIDGDDMIFLTSQRIYLKKYKGE